MCTRYKEDSCRRIARRLTFGLGAMLAVAIAVVAYAAFFGGGV